MSELFDSALFLGFPPTGTVDAGLGHIHRVTQRDPDIPRWKARGEGVGRTHAELVEHDVAHESATEFAELDIDRSSEFGVLHALGVMLESLDDEVVVADMSRLRPVRSMMKTTR